MNREQEVLQDLLDSGEAGITINGSNPWDPQVHNDNLYKRILGGGSLGLGESYVDEWWDCDDLGGFYVRVAESRIGSRLRPSIRLLWSLFTASIFNLQTKVLAQKAIDAHYEDDNTRAFEYIYDKSMAASCGYFKDGNEDLETAQSKKLALVCDKLGLKEGDRVLDIGCGWGSFVSYAARERGAIPTGITRSRSQAEYIENRYKDLPITVIRADYRDANLSQEFDAVASVEMIGHVGPRNYPTFFGIARDALKDEGLFFLQETTFNVRNPRLDPFIDKYIFPNAVAPTPGQAEEGAEPFFVLEDSQNIGAMHYDTLTAWQKNMEKNKDIIIDMHGSRWYRMMSVYHTSCAAAYKTRIAGCHQWMFSPCGVPSGYISPR